MLKRYKRNGKVAYLDPIRAFLVEARPEETVRQHFLHRLVHEYGVPERSIAVEYPVRKGGGSSKRRVDILIMGGVGRPLLVVECKEPGTLLHGGVRDQASSYADELGCPYFSLTNGAAPETFHRVAGKWKRLAHFPSFKAMQSQLGLRYEEPPSRTFPPLSIDELQDLDLIADHDAALLNNWGYCVLGDDTPQDLWTPIYCLYNAIYHQVKPQAFPRMKAGDFRLEEYLGLYFTEYGNFSGGKFPGLYASFRVVDASGDDQIYKLAFSATAHTENDPKYGNRKGTSGIHVAIDDFDNAPHMSLEMSLDTCLKVRSRGFDVVHDGKITVGQLGAARRDLLIEFVAQRAPDLVRDGAIALGSFPEGRALEFVDVKGFVFNLLRYADIRDRFRIQHKNRRARQRYLAATETVASASRIEGQDWDVGDKIAVRWTEEDGTDKVYNPCTVIKIDKKRGVFDGYTVTFPDGELGQIDADRVEGPSAIQG
jgi:hypothetical protein